MPEAVSDAAGSRFGDGADSADGERNAKQSQVVVVDLVAQTGVPDLVESLEMVETRGIAVRHDEAVKGDSEPSLSEVLDLAGFAEDLRVPAGIKRCWRSWE